MYVIMQCNVTLNFSFYVTKPTPFCILQLRKSISYGASFVQGKGCDCFAICKVTDSHLTIELSNYVAPT